MLRIIIAALLLSFSSVAAAATPAGCPPFAGRWIVEFDLVDVTQPATAEIETRYAYAGVIRKLDDGSGDVYYDLWQANGRDGFGGGISGLNKFDNVDELLSASPGNACFVSFSTANGWILRLYYTGQKTGIIAIEANEPTDWKVGTGTAKRIYFDVG